MVPQAAIPDGAKLDKVYAPPKKALEGLLELKEISGAVLKARLKLHEQVDVASLGVVILAQDGSEYLELANAVKVAQSADFLEFVVDERWHMAPEPLQNSLSIGRRRW